MPENSYTLILDGGPDMEYTSEVFRVVQRDIAWQTALDLACMRGLLFQETWQDRRRFSGYMYEKLPDLVRSLSRDGALFRTNFDRGNPYDPENLLEEHQGWSEYEWKDYWDTHQPKSYQTKAPLPSWHLLRWQYVLCNY
jgi:hypothetical protein